jgi:D-alanine transaminase
MTRVWRTLYEERRFLYILPSMILSHDRILDDGDVRISPLDRGYYFGDGVYEVLRIYNGRFYTWHKHIDRFLRSLDAVRIPLPYPIDRLAELLEELRVACGVRDGSLYVQITRGEAPRSHAFPESCSPVLIAWCNSFPRHLDVMREGIDVVTVEDIRWLRCDIKSLNLLPNVLAKQEAKEKGADEAVLHRNGTVTEGSSGNLMIVKGGAVRTHPADHLILPGVTRAVTIELASKLKISVREEAFRVSELMEADEVFVTGTTVEVCPVKSVDGRKIKDGKPGPVTRRLQEAFEKTIPGA